MNGKLISELSIAPIEWLVMLFGLFNALAAFQ